MHIAIDAVGIRVGGGATVLLDLIAAAAACCDVQTLTVFCSPKPSRRFEFPDCKKLNVVERSLSDMSAAARFWWLVAGLARATRRSGADVLLCFNGVGVASGSIPQVAFVQQSLPFSAEGFDRLGFRLKARSLAIRAHMRLCCRRSLKVIVQTPTMAKWVGSAFGIPAEKLVIALPSIHLSTDDAVVTQSPVSRLINRCASDSRLLYVGNEASYKNLELIAGAMPRVRRVVKRATLFATIRPKHPACRVEGVVPMGHLSPAAVQTAYRCVSAIVMPSLVETVGLPMLEAMANCVPVLAADRPYARDVCGDAALYFDPLDSSDFVRQVARILTDEKLRNELISAGKQIIHKRQLGRPYEAMIATAVECGSIGSNRT